MCWTSQEAESEVRSGSADCQAQSRGRQPGLCSPAALPGTPELTPGRQHSEEEEEVFMIL